MGATGLTVDALCSIVSEIPPLELLGTKLLRQHRPQGRLLPPPTVDREELSKAVQELVDYTRKCVEVAEQLQTLPPIKLQLTMPQHRSQRRLLSSSTVDCEELGQAVCELVDYTQKCGEMAERLTSLPPIRLQLPVPEYGL
jgi:CRISPR/Cas system-associated endonuclease Cas1